MIRVGFWFDYGLVYAGGLNYFRNLLQAIHVARQDDVQTVLFISKDLPAALEEELKQVTEVVKLDLLTRGTAAWFVHRSLYRSVRCQLLVERIDAGLMVRLTTDGAEAFFQLDRTGRHVSVAMTTGCTNFGSCITDQAPVGLTILDGQLRFLFGGQAVSEEELAVKILTDLLEANAPKASR